MSYIIAVDSCGELTEEMKADGHFQSIPLSIQVDDHMITDDETFDQADFLRLVEESPNCPKSSCPSPEAYRSVFDCGADHVYAVTLSAELSGSYNSALLGKSLLQEEKPNAKIHVFNSRGASVGQTLIAMKIRECEEAGMTFSQVVSTVESYIQGQTILFVLESLETLRKNGRLSNLKAFVATALKIKPVMKKTPEGMIAQLDQARGINKALVKMVGYFAEMVEHPEDKVLAVAHCNCRERAMMVRDAIMEKMPCKEVLILDTRGISSMYASDGGIIIAG